jgi:hypothetical protein
MFIFFSITISRGTPSDISRKLTVPRNPGWETLVYAHQIFKPGISRKQIQSVAAQQIIQTGLPMLSKAAASRFGHVGRQLLASVVSNAFP